MTDRLTDEELARAAAAFAFASATNTEGAAQPCVPLLPLATAILGQYENPKLRSAMSRRMDQFATRLHDAVELKQIRSGSGPTPEIGASDINDCFDSLLSDRSDSPDLVFATFFLSLGGGGMFTLLATAATARPSGGLTVAWCLVALGLFSLLLWVRGRRPN